MTTLLALLAALGLMAVPAMASADDLDDAWDEVEYEIDENVDLDEINEPFDEIHDDWQEIEYEIEQGADELEYEFENTYEEIEYELDDDDDWDLGDGVDEPGLDIDDVDWNDDVDVNEDWQSIEYQDDWDLGDGVDEPGLDIDDVDWNDDVDMDEGYYEIDYERVDINRPYDEIIYERGAVRTRVDEPVVNLGSPTLDGLIASANNVSVIRVSTASVALGNDCDVFYGATFDVERNLAGKTLPMHERRLGRAEMLSADECDFVNSEDDVVPYFSSGERFILFHSSDWGDVVLPVSMLNEVNDRL